MPRLVRKALGEDLFLKLIRNKKWSENGTEFKSLIMGWINTSRFCNGGENGSKQTVVD